MAPKKANHMEEPPAASSSEGEEEETSEEVPSSEDEGEEEEEDTQEPTKPSSPPPQKTQKQTAVKKPGITSATPQSKSSSSEESGSESRSESEPDATPKPVATKPMEETPKATKSRSKPAAKRPTETEEALKDSKRAKKKGADPDEEKKPGEDTKKQLFQRLWSEDDEIAVLKGMIEYSTKKGVDPNQDMNAFHDYIKKSLHVDVSRAQLVDKIRRLKKKYENNLEKGLKKGEDQTFSKPHEQKAYDLSKRLWGSESTSGVIESAAKSNGKARKNQNQRGNTKSLASLKAELINGAKEGENMEVDSNKEGNVVDKSVNVKEKDSGLFDKSFGVTGLEEFVIKDGLDMIGGVKKTELEERWKKLQIAQLELFVRRNELIKEQAKLVLEALKSSGI